ncbi:MAG: hypothetical protein ACLQGV_19390 [Bryobacteraceae bacterium]
MAKETKKVATRRAGVSKRARLEVLLRTRIWPAIPREVLGSAITRDEEARILGYSPGGC